MTPSPQHGDDATGRSPGTGLLDLRSGRYIQFHIVGTNTDDGAGMTDGTNDCRIKHSLI